MTYKSNGMKTKKVLRLKKIKVLRGVCVRFDTMPTQQSPAINGVYISVAAWPGIENASEVRVTIQVVK